MPFLPISYYSNYYLVEMNYQSFFDSLGISYTGPAGTARFIANSFNISHSGGMSKKTMIQGKAGHAVQDAPTPYYTYTIEAPMIINGYTYPGATGFFPYNSLNYFALWMANWQWQQLNGYSSQESLNLMDCYVALVSYDISVTASGVTQKIVLKSNRLLGDLNLGGLQIEAFNISQLYSQDYGAYLDVVQYIGRTVRNYDIFTNLSLYEVTETGTNPSFNLISSENGTMLETSNFSISFEITENYLLNTGNEVIFLIKNYDIKQKYGIIGLEPFVFAHDFAPGEFYYYNTQNNLSIGSDNNRILIRYDAPMLVKSKAEAISNGALIKTDFELSFYGTQYGPGNSPFGGLYLFYSDIA